MIGRLRGTVAGEAGDGTLVIDVHGVGYEVMAPLGTLGRAPREADGVVTLQIQTHVREDAITLFGFADERERMAFRLLTSVAGVGPKIAIAILGSLPASELVGAVARSDVRRFQSIAGVGKKIAERLVLELKDKLASGVLGTGSHATMGVNGASHGGAAVPAASAGVPLPRVVGPMSALVDTLMKMGFKPLEAERAASELKERSDEPLEVLVREALRVLT